MWDNDVGMLFLNPFSKMIKRLTLSVEVQFAFVILSSAGNLKILSTKNWNQTSVLEPLSETGSDLTISPDGTTAYTSLMNGDIVSRPLPAETKRTAVKRRSVEPVYMDLSELTVLREEVLRQSAKSNPSLADQIVPDNASLPVGRGVKISGTIAMRSEFDQYSWSARAGEVWAIDADASPKSPIDTLISVLDATGEPVLRTRLQAVRDSYFTFRGKDSKQIGDFRVFNWREMQLNEYFYSGGEVTRLFLYPRGPDSGFNVYPNEGQRWTFFGTSPVTHALGEPAYIVRPLAVGQEAVANGLPVFDIFYENDDDPSRGAGTNSRLVFVAPHDGKFTVRITDTRGAGSDRHQYDLSIRAAEPGFVPSVSKANGKLRRGAGREFRVRVDRLDGFDGPVSFEVEGLAPGMVTNSPIVVQAGQRYADGTVWIPEDVPSWEGSVSPTLVARATVNGQLHERAVGSLGELTLDKRPSAIPSIQPIDREVAENEGWTLSVRRGETASARVVIRRAEKFTNEVSFGKENAGRNTAHGVYVDNIGLNGLLVRANENEREFFLTADPVAELGKRQFFLTGNVDGKVTTHPITVEVLP